MLSRLDFYRTGSSIPKMMLCALLVFLCVVFVIFGYIVAIVTIGIGLMLMTVFTPLSFLRTLPLYMLEDRPVSITRITILLPAIGALLFTCIVMSQSYLVNGLIPVGWDTGRHLYQARVLLDFNLIEFFEMCDGNNFVPFVMIAGTSFFFGFDIFIARIALTYILVVSLQISLYVTGKLATRSTKGAVVSVLISAVWLTTYRLSADLHKTLIAITLLYPLLVMLSGNQVSRKRRLWIGVIVFVAAFTQIEMAVLFFGCLFLLKIYRIAFQKEDVSQAISDFLWVFIFILPAFIFALSFNTYFVRVAFDFTGVLAPPGIEVSILYLGGIMLPVVILALVHVVTHESGLRRIRLELMGIFSLAILFLIVIPSYFISNPTVFRKMATRAVTIVPVPVLVSICLFALISGNRVSLLPVILNADEIPKRDAAILLVAFVVLSGFLIAPQIGVNQKPFITQQTYSLLHNLTTDDFNSQAELFLHVTNEDRLHAYRDDSWFGAFFGWHLHFNGPINYLLAGRTYPVKDELDYSYNQDLTNSIGQSNANITNILEQGAVVTLSDFYSDFTTHELEHLDEIEPGIFSWSYPGCLSLLETYSLRVYEPYDFEGPWSIYRTGHTYAAIDDTNSTNDIFISYPILIYATGNYSISILYSKYNLASGFEMQLDQSPIWTQNYNNESGDAWVSVNITAVEGVSFLSFHPISDTSHTYIVLRQILVSHL